MMTVARPSNPGALKASSPRPYLLRAFYEWMVDNGLTPHLLVDTEAPSVEVPRIFVGSFAPHFQPLMAGMSSPYFWMARPLPT